MGLAQVQPPAGYYRFVALLTWPPQGDAVAAKTLARVLHAPQGVDTVNTHAYNLTGARSVIIVGFTPNAQGLQTFISSIVFGTEIEAKVYHAVEALELGDLLPPPPPS
jgi:hypothetical protein